ncbi:hypothetical protein D3C87_2157700 [compost metagenome]
MQETVIFLKRILRAHDKPDLFEVCGGSHRVGDDQMPDMDWIERSEKQADLHR